MSIWINVHNILYVNAGLLNIDLARKEVPQKVFSFKVWQLVALPISK